MRKLQDVLGDLFRPVDGGHHDAAGLPGGLQGQIAGIDDSLAESLVKPHILHLGELHDPGSLGKQASLVTKSVSVHI